MISLAKSVPIFLPVLYLLLFAVGLSLLPSKAQAKNERLKCYDPWREGSVHSGRPNNAAYGRHDGTPPPPSRGARPGRFRKGRVHDTPW